jgi:hypothetical protein
MKKREITILCVFFSLLIFQDAFSWDNEVTHKDLSEYAAKNSILSTNKGNYLNNLGFSGGLDEVFAWQGNNWTVTKWLREGVQREDKDSWGFPILPGSTTRSFNHFHNPLKPWDQAGLADTWTGESSLLWAQDGSAQTAYPDGDWSWIKVREYFYIALTGRDFTGTDIATTKEARGEYFARTFRGLGQQMHLIQDAGQPDKEA